jgi:hypothetical protein
MSTVDNMNTFSYSCICDRVELYGIALMLSATRMKCCGGMRAVVFLLNFLRHLDLNLFIKCELYFCSFLVFNLQNIELVLLVLLI